MNKIIRFLINLPVVLPVMAIYKVYLLHRLINETENMEDLESISSEEELEELLDPHLESFYETYRIPMYILTAVIWTKIISAILTN